LLFGPALEYNTALNVVVPSPGLRQGGGEMASAAVLENDVRRDSDPLQVRAYCWVITAAFVILVPLFANIGSSTWVVDAAELAGWVVLVAVADLLRVRLWSDFSFAMSMPISLASVIVLAPWQAAVVAALGSLDLRELKGEVPFGRALFNRAEVGLSVLAAGLVFRGLGGEAAWPDLLWPVLVAGTVDLLVNTAIVLAPVAWLHRTSVAEVLRRTVGPAPAHASAIYLALWLLAPLTAVAYLEAGLAGVAMVVAPAGVARLAFVQTLKVSEVAEDLQVKRQALATATDRAAQERRDERRMLAGELHDEVLPALFKVHLLGEVLRKDLQQGRLLDLEADVPELAAATDAAQAAIRRVMNDLRQSSLGRDGLVSTLKLLARSLESASASRFVMNLAPAVNVDHLSQLVIYQVAREAMTNAARYANVDSIDVRLTSEAECVRLVVSDSGVGFALDSVDLTEHLGLQLMRERVESIGGQLVIDSRIGVGTTIVASIPGRSQP
jgi:signal transduction histidine kinase